MVFEYGLEKDAYHYNRRTACRAIIYRDNKLLMVTTNLGDCMFPGGGKKPGENSVEALKREVLEETGYRCKKVGALVCTAYERKPDKYVTDQYFEMESEFYISEVGTSVENQKLDYYEAKRNFRPVWMDIDEAIEMNIYYRSQLAPGDIWRLKTIDVLKMIKENSQLFRRLT